jgi:hypothetical protein
MVDRGGFEPPASAVRERRSYQTDLPARQIGTEKAFAEDLEVSVGNEFGDLTTSNLESFLVGFQGLLLDTKDLILKY